MGGRGSAGDGEVQDRYVGDVGDFGKYGLLRALCANDHTLGVVWYLVPDEQGTGDGGHVGFLDPTPRNLRRFRDCDPSLHGALGEIVEDGARDVRSVRERGILSEGTVFYEEVLSFAGMPSVGRAAKERRLERRKAWAWGALAATRGCHVVFADPDNGLEPRAGLPRHRLTGPKYAYFDELVPYLDRGQSLVVYHHLHRSLAHESQVRDRLSQVEERLGPAFALRFRPGTGRAFFIVPAEAHREVLRERALRLVRNRCWSRHFELYESEGPE